MIQTVIEWDRLVLGVINGHHTMFLDTLMVVLTSGPTWVPLYIALLYLVIKNNENVAQILLVITCVIFCMFTTEFVTEGIVKPMVARPRPGSDPEWMNMVHAVFDRRSTDYSFFSAHASNTFGIAVFFSLLVRNKCFTWFMIAWALVNCYTRLYLAMHYPSDILVGILYGTVVGAVAYLVFWGANRLFMPKQKYVSSHYSTTGYDIADVDVVACVMASTFVLAVIVSLYMH